MSTSSIDRIEKGKRDSNEDEDASSKTISELSRSPEDGDQEPTEKGAPQASLELTRTISTKLSRVASRITNRHIVDPGPAPDGGLKAWTQVGCAWIVIITTWGYLNSFGVFQTYYTSHLNISSTAVSWIGSVQLFIIFLLSAFSGRALDAGLFIPAFIVGSILQVLGIFMNSLCTKFWQILLAQGVCTGLGSGIIFCPSLGLVTTYFTKNRAIAIAIVTTGNSLGGAIYPIMVRQLLPQIGFAWTVRVIGFVNLAVLAIGLAFMRPRLPPRKSGPLIEWRAFTEIPYCSTVVGLSFVVGSMFFTYYYLSSYGFDILHMSLPSSANLTIIFNAVGIPARLLTGFAADRWTGPLNAIIILIFINGICAFCWIAVRSVGGMYAETCVYGLAAGAFQCLFPTTITSLHSDLSKNGVRLGMAFSFFSFAGLTGPPIGGAILAAYGGGRLGYLAALLGVGIATMLGVALICIARVNKAGWKLTVKC